MIDNEDKFDREIEQVVELMQDLCDPSITDWNYVDDKTVQLLDKDDNIVKVITGDKLTNLWNRIE